MAAKPKKHAARKARPKGKRGKNPGKGGFKRCVAAVEAKGGAYSPRGVCAAQERRRLGKKKFAALAAAGRKKKRRPNPVDEAAERYEFFHGHPPEKVFTFKIPEHRHSVTWGVGKLVEMEIAAIGASKVITLGFEKTLLSANEKRTQIFLKGGDQSVNLRDFGIEHPHEFENLGALVAISYDTTKSHLTPETGGKAIYDHKFGKGGKRLPMVVYDVRNKTLHVVGGEYTLAATGIKG